MVVHKKISKELIRAIRCCQKFKFFSLSERSQKYCKIQEIDYYLGIRDQPANFLRALLWQWIRKWFEISPLSEKPLIFYPLRITKSEEKTYFSLSRLRKIFGPIYKNYYVFAGFSTPSNTHKRISRKLFISSNISKILSIIFTFWISAMHIFDKCSKFPPLS